MISIRDFLVRGLLAGLVGGVLAFGVAYLVGEPSVESAISLEGSAATAPSHSPDSVAHRAALRDRVVGDSSDDFAAGATQFVTASLPGATSAASSADGVLVATPAHGGEHGDEEGTMVPRSLQSTLGLLTGTLLLGLALGGLAGVGLGVAVGRLGRLSVRATALWLAGGAFVVLHAVPFLAYPPNPPAVGSGETIGSRTGLYFGMVGLSVVFAALALVVGRQVNRTHDGFTAGVVGVLLYAVLSLTAVALVPSYDEVPAGFPAQVLFEFRQGSLLTQLALWVGIGLTLAVTAHRLVEGRTSARADGSRERVPA